MARALSVSGYLLGHAARVLRRAGVAPDTALASSGLDEDALAAPDARVPLDAAIRFWNDIAALSGEPRFGLTIASHLGEGFPLLRYVLRNSASLGEAYERWGRFYGLIADIGVVALSRGDDGASMSCELHPDVSLPVLIEDWMVAQWLTLGRSLIDRDWTPTRVAFRRAAHGDGRDYETWFQAPVAFGAPRAEMWFDPKLLDAKVAGADPALAQVLDRHIGEVLARRSAGSTVAERVRKVVADAIANGAGELPVPEVARALGMSERTLLRRLREEGATASDVITEVRATIALRYLSDPRISITETAMLLGYSEPSAFHRAFKRWTGKTPAEVRAAR